MKNLIIRTALSLALTASIINLSFNTYNHITNKPVEKHKVIEAGWFPNWAILFLMAMSEGFSGEGSGGGAG